MSLALHCDLRDAVGIPPDLSALFLLASSRNAVTLAVIRYTGFLRPETRFTLVVTRSRGMPSCWHCHGRVAIHCRVVFSIWRRRFANYWFF